jgi:hypothetical protein
MRIQGEAAIRHLRRAADALRTLSNGRSSRF